MKKNNKKGFTIVELVIVIAVIAILSAVLIPTFGGIIDSANESAALQKANNAYKSYIIESKADASDLKIVVDGKYTYSVTSNKLNDTPVDAITEAPNGYHKVAYPLSENNSGIVVYVAGTCGDSCTVCAGHSAE